jgi:hypothetical protein
MKIETDSKGNIILKEVFSSLILETEEGNRIAVCMRDNTFEIQTPGGRWHRVDMEYGTIKPLSVSRARQIVEEHAVAPAKEKFSPELWLPQKFVLNYLETYLNMDPEDLIPGLYYAVDADTQDELDMLIPPLTEILADSFSMSVGYAGKRASEPLNEQKYSDIVKGIVKADCETLSQMRINPIIYQLTKGPVVWGNSVVHPILRTLPEVCALRTIQINTKKIVKAFKDRGKDTDTVAVYEVHKNDLIEQLEDLRRWMLASRLVLEMDFTVVDAAPISIDFSIRMHNGNPGAHRMRWYGGLNSPREFSDLRQYFG